MRTAAVDRDAAERRLRPVQPWRRRRDADEPSPGGAASQAIVAERPSPATVESAGPLPGPPATSPVGRRRRRVRGRGGRRRRAPVTRDDGPPSIQAGGSASDGRPRSESRTAGRTGRLSTRLGGLDPPLRRDVAGQRANRPPSGSHTAKQAGPAGGGAGRVLGRDRAPRRTGVADDVTGSLGSGPVREGRHEDRREARGDPRRAPRSGKADLVPRRPVVARRVSVSRVVARPSAPEDRRRPSQDCGSPAGRAGHRRTATSPAPRRQDDAAARAAGPERRPGIGPSARKCATPTPGSSPGVTRRRVARSRSARADVARELDASRRRPRSRGGCARTVPAARAPFAEPVTGVPPAVGPVDQSGRSMPAIAARRPAQPSVTARRRSTASAPPREPRCL